MRKSAVSLLLINAERYFPGEPITETLLAKAKVIEDEFWRNMKIVIHGSEH